MNEGKAAYTPLVETVHADEANRLVRALEAARIPHDLGLAADTPPRVVLYVPRNRLREARAAIAQFEAEDNEAFFEPPPAKDPEAARFPWGPVQAAAGLVLLHLLIVFRLRAPDGRGLFQRFALIADATLGEPWRLVTSLFLHVDPAHALWNGVAMLVFAVPLLVELGYAGTILIYLVAGVGGALTALEVAPAGTVIVGSSGAVAGLFGGWVAMRLRTARLQHLGWRYRMRTLGIASLFLPSLLNPTTSSGQPVSVGSHLGGLATGVLIGALLSGRLIARMEAQRPRPEWSDG